MADPVTLDVVREHLRASTDDASEAYLSILTAASRRACESTIGFPITGDAVTDDDMAAVAQARLLLISHWFNNRELVVVGTASVPIELARTVGWLLGAIRNRSL